MSVIATLVKYRHNLSISIFFIVHIMTNTINVIQNNIISVTTVNEFGNYHSVLLKLISIALMELLRYNNCM